MELSQTLYNRIARTQHPAALMYWVKEILNGPLSEQTKRKYINWGIQFVERYGQDIPRKLGLASLYEAYVQDLVQAGYAKGTIQARLSAIENLAKYFAKGYRTDAFSGLQRFSPSDAPRRRTELLTPKDLERLYATAKTLKEKAALRLCIELRLSAGQVARLKHTETGYTTGGKALDMPKDLAELLSQLTPNADGFVFVAPDGYPWTAQRVRIILHRLAKRAGIEKRVTPRAIRYTLAATDIAKGIDPTQAAQSLGLQSQRTAYRLAKLTKELPKPGLLESLKGLLLGAFTKLAALFTQSG